METTDSPSSPGTSLEARVTSLEQGVRLFAATILLLSGIPGLMLALAIKPYAAALSKMARPLPISPVYMFVLDHPAYFITLAVLLPLAGIIITARAQRPLRAMVASCVYLLLVLIQFSLTWAAFVASAKAVVGPLRM